MRITIRRQILAPVELVFDTVADIRNFSQALPHVVRYEFLSEKESGLGTRFRETRLMGGKEATTELEVTEYAPNDHVRMVADSHGAVWDTTFTVGRQDDATQLTVVMDARPHQLLPRIMNTLFKPMIAKAVARDMDLVKNHCESSS